MELIDTPATWTFPSSMPSGEACWSSGASWAWASISSPPWERRTGDGSGRWPSATTRSAMGWGSIPGMWGAQTEGAGQAGVPAGEPVPWVGGGRGVRAGSAHPGVSGGQIEMFEAQVRLAMAYDLPLIVHSVRANDTVAKILRRFKPARGVSSTPSADLSTRQRRSGSWGSGWG